jgi:hypothetical protein
VSNNGTSWTTLWEHTGSALSDTAWSQHVFDISAVADDQATVYFRWGMGPTDTSVTYPGWNIDDVEIWAIVPYEGCPGDLNGDGYRNVSDFSMFVACYGSHVGDENYDTKADLNGDGFINVADFSMMASVYGVACP